MVMPVMPSAGQAEPGKTPEAIAGGPIPESPSGPLVQGFAAFYVGFIGGPKKDGQVFRGMIFFIYFPSNFEVFNFSLSCLRLLYIHRFYGTFILRCS